jgi:hypothetical protein
MEARFTGVADMMKAVQAEITALEKQAVEEARSAAVIVQEAFFSFTPVWEGETVRNYAWGVGTAPSSAHKDAIGVGDPGPTGSFPLGSEPRRGPNEAAVLAELKAQLNFTKLVDLTLTNNSDIWDLVDNGSAPTTERARNPGGVSKNAVSKAAASLKHWK